MKVIALKLQHNMTGTNVHEYIIITFRLPVNSQWNFVNDDLQSFSAVVSRLVNSSDTRRHWTQKQNRVEIFGKAPWVFLFEGLHLTSKKISSLFLKLEEALLFDLKKTTEVPRIRNWIKTPLSSPGFRTSRYSISIIPWKFTNRVKTSCCLNTLQASFRHSFKSSLCLLINITSFVRLLSHFLHFGILKVDWFG